jgi:hypothetical protein
LSTSPRSSRPTGRWPRSAPDAEPAQQPAPLGGPDPQIPEGGIGQCRPRQQEEPEERDDPAVERAAQDAAGDPPQKQDEPRLDQREKREQAPHASESRGPRRARLTPALHLNRAARQSLRRPLGHGPGRPRRFATARAALWHHQRAPRRGVRADFRPRLGPRGHLERVRRPEGRVDSASRNRTTCRRIAEWRDPDSNRGHHDFQDLARKSLTRRNPCADAGSRAPERRRLIGAICELFSRVWVPGPLRVPNATAIAARRAGGSLPRLRSLADSVARAGAASCGLATRPERSPRLEETCSWRIAGSVGSLAERPASPRLRSQARSAGRSRVSSHAATSRISSGVIASRRYRS